MLQDPLVTCPCRATALSSKETSRLEISFLEILARNSIKAVVSKAVDR